MTPKANTSPRKLPIGRLVRDYIVLSGGQFISKILGFAIFAYLARVLTVAEYGAVETVVGMSLIGYKVVEMGTGSIAVRWITQNTSDLRATLGAVISARFLIALIVVPVLGFAYSTAAGADLPTQLVWLFALSLFAAPFAHEWLFQAHEKMAIAAFGPMLRMFVFVAAVLALSPARIGVAAVGYAEIIGIVVAAIYYSVAARVTLGARAPHYGVKPAIRLASQSAPLGISAFLNSFGLYGPVLVVTAVAGAEQAGLFGAAHRVVASATTFSFVYYFNIYPLLSRLLASDPPRLQELLNASVRVTGWVGVTLALGMWAVGDPAMRIIFGKDFAAAGPIFSTLGWMMVFELVSGNARWLLVAAHRQNSLAIAQAIGAVTAIILTYVFAGQWGGVGAALAVVIANAGIWIYAQIRTEGLPAHPPLGPLAAPVAAAVVLYAVISIWGPNPFVAGALIAIVMGALAIADAKFLAAVKMLSHAKNA